MDEQAPTPPFPFVTQIKKEEEQNQGNFLNKLFHSLV